MALSKLPWNITDDRTKIVAAPEEGILTNTEHVVAKLTALDQANAAYIVKSVNLMYIIETYGLTAEVDDLLQRNGISIV